MRIIRSRESKLFRRYGLVGEPERLVKKREMGIFTDRFFFYLIDMVELKLDWN